ncbi:MAG: redoxin family protein [Chloroflexi bacterium]|nr:redoxin family protein [Chloroflexota bacterium]
MKHLKSSGLICIFLIVFSAVSAASGAPRMQSAGRVPITAENISAGLAEIATFEHGGDEVFALAFSPDGQRIATGASDGRIRLWDTSGENLDPVLSWPAHDLEIYALAFAPDGLRLASTGWDGWLRVWELPTPGPWPVFKYLLGEPGYSLAYSPDGLWLALGTGYAANRLLLWPAQDIQFSTQVLRSHYDWVTEIVFSADSTALMSASADGSIREWTLDDTEPFRVLSGHAAPVSSALFSPDGSVIASSGLDGAIRLWDATSGQPLRVIKTGYVSQIAYSPDGSVIAAGARDGKVTFWSPLTGEELGTIQAHYPWVNGIAFSPDGTLLATTGEDGTAKLWGIPVPASTRADPVGGTEITSPSQSGNDAEIKAQMELDALKIHLHNTRSGDLTVWAGGTLGTYLDVKPTWPLFSALPDTALPGLGTEYAGFNLNEFERPTLVNFWASWCGPCVQEFPLLTEVAADPAQHAYDVVFVNSWDEKGPALEFLLNQPEGLNVAVDPEGALLNTLGSIAIPTSVLLDADHRVIAIHVGNYTSVQAALFERLAQNPDLYTTVKDVTAQPAPDHFVEIGSVDLAQAVRITSDERLRGALSGENWLTTYQFEGHAGDVVTVRLEALPVRMNTYSLEPYVILLTPDGRYLAESSDYLYEPFAQIQHITLPEDGLYGVIATRYMGAEGISQGEYSLRLTVQ